MFRPSHRNIPVSAIAVVLFLTFLISDKGKVCRET